MFERSIRPSTSVMRQLPMPGRPESTAESGAGQAAWVAAALLLCIALMLILAVRKGAWIDEYWTIWETDPSMPVRQLLWQRMLPDVGHPPLFDLMQWSLAHLTRESLLLKRLTNLLVGLVLLLPTLALMRPQFARNRYRLAVVLAVLASPLVFGKFGEHRAYFSDACAVLALVLCVREMLLRSFSGLRLPSTLIVWFVLIACLAINLDYTNALASDSLLFCSSVYSWLRRKRGLALLIAGVGIGATGLLAAQLGMAISMGTTTPSSQLPLLKGSFVLVMIAASGGLVASPLILGKVRDLKALARKDVGTVDGERFRFAAMLVATLLCCVGGLLAVEFLSRALLARHAIPAVPLFAALLVELGTLRRSSNLEVLAFCGAATASALIVTFVKGNDRGWEAYAPLIAEQVRSCPRTKVIAFDPLLLSGDPRWSPYAGMIEATNATYRAVAKKWDFPIISVREHLHPVAPAADCPTIVWAEQNFENPWATNAQIANAAGLLVSPAQLASARRVDRGKSRTLLIVPPTARLASLGAAG
jgi:hypothetical protein